MSCIVAKRIESYLKNLSSLKKDIEFYEQMKSLIRSFQNLEMDSKWDNASTSKSETTTSKIITSEPVYKEYNIENIVQIKYSDDKNEVILQHSNEPAIKFTYDGFGDFLYFLETINDKDGQCDIKFYIGDYIYVSYWQEEESRGMIVADFRTNEVMALNEKYLELVLRHKYHLYEICL
nr:hypothetical protein [Rickettsia endosymbiont of Ceutorhynchus assimilis]